MYKFEILENINHSEWNEYLSQVPYSTFFQTKEFLLPEEKNSFPIFVYVRDSNNSIKGQLGLLIRKSIPGRSNYIFKNITKIISRLSRRGSWVSGPILHSDSKKEREQILASIIAALDEIIKKYHLILLDGYSPPQDFNVDQNYLHQFMNNGYTNEKFITFMIELDNYSLDDLWQKIKKNARNDVTKAQRNDIQIKEIESKNDLKKYEFLAKRWAKTKGMEISDPLKNLEKDWIFLNSGIQRLFLAYKNDVILAGLRIGCFNKIAYTHQVLNSYSEYGNTSGPLLTWYALKWAKENDMHVYDFSGGKALSDKNDKQYSEQWNSLFAYKRKWGGIEFPYYHFVKVTNSKKYKLFRIVAKSDFKLREFKRKRHNRPIKNIQSCS